VACERDQWGRAIAGLSTNTHLDPKKNNTHLHASIQMWGTLQCFSDPTFTFLLFLGHVNVAPRHLTAEAETLLSATLIHEVMHVLGFDPHAFTHFRDERKRRRGQVLKNVFPHFIRVIYFLLLNRDPNAQTPQD
jgi:hypothetical protein